MFSGSVTGSHWWQVSSGQAQLSPRQPPVQTPAPVRSSDCAGNTVTVRPWTFSRPQAGETTNRPLTTIRGEKRSNGRQKWGSVGQWLTPSGGARNRLHGPESILELSSEAKNVAGRGKGAESTSGGGNSTYSHGLGDSLARSLILQMPGE